MLIKGMYYKKADCMPYISEPIYKGQDYYFTLFTFKGNILCDRFAYKAAPSNF